MGARRTGRELALKALYQADIRGPEPQEEFWSFFERSPADSQARAFARKLVMGVLAERDAFDRQLAEVLEHWSVARLSHVDHNVLRLALYELRYLQDVPARVTMDEAIELAKRYGDRDSGRFVNGVLDELVGRLGLRSKGEGEAQIKAE